MKYRVAIDSLNAPWLVELPDQTPIRRWFDVKTGSVASLAYWDPAQNTLKIKSGTSALERIIRLRSVSITRSEDETSLALEALAVRATFSPAAAQVQASVGLYLAAHEARQGGGAQKKTVTVRSQIAGKVLSVGVSVGERITKGQTLCIVEAMKMENRVFATANGVVESIKVKAGDSVANGDELLRMAPPSDAK